MRYAVIPEAAPAQAPTRQVQPVVEPADSAPSSTPVLVVSHGFQSNYERGFCNGLAASGRSVTLISSDRTDYGGLHPDISARNLRGSQEEARPWWAKLFNIVRYHALLLGLVWERRGNWIVHVIGLTQPPLLCGVLEGLWFRALGARYVLTVHDLLPHDNHSLWMRGVHRLVYRIPHQLVVHTQRMADELARDFSVDVARLTVMEHGIEPVSTELATRQAAAQRQGPLRLLFFGHVMRYKGLDVLLEALEGAGPDIQLVISGLCIDTGLVRELQQRLAAHPLGAAISWHNGFVTEARMEELFRAADAIVLPYRHIDQSGVLFQALRLGVPVIATRAGSLHTYVTPDIGELCEPGSVPDLRRAIQRFASRQGAFCPDRIRERGRLFDWSITVRALDRIYRCIPPARASGRPRGPILFVGEGRLGNQVFQYVAIRAWLGEAGVWATGLSSVERVFEPIKGLHAMLQPGVAERIVRRILVPLAVRPLFKWLRLGNYCHEPMRQLEEGTWGMSGELACRKGLLPLTFVDGGYYQNLSQLLKPDDFRCLAPRADLIAQARRAAQAALQGRPWPRVVLHVRRGDYVGWSSYGLKSVLLPEDYFSRAIAAAREHAGSEAELLVVTDDEDWCRRELARFAPLTVLSVDELVDFVLLTLFPVVILSNSTFSLAAACVGRDVERIIGPEYWFGHSKRQWLPFHIRSNDPRFRYV